MSKGDQHPPKVEPEIATGETESDIARADPTQDIARSFRVRKPAVIELVGFLGLLLLADYFLGSGNRLVDWSPHPFWIIVVLLSVQYGTNEGIMAAIASAVALLAWNLPAQGVEQDLYDYLHQVALTPILWMVAAVVFGELRMRQINERDILRRDLAAASEREKVLSKRYRDLDAIKDRLEERVAGQLKTVYSTYQAAREIESLGVGRVLMGMSNLVESVLSPKKHSIFLLKGNDLQSTFGKGWSRDDTYKRAFDSSSSLFQAVIGRQQIVTVAEPLGEKIMSGQGILAGPLIDHETGEVVGMLKIEELGFLDYNLGTIESFRILCEWLAAAYANARNYERAKTYAAFEPEINMMSANIYDRMCKIIKSIAVRVGFDVSMLMFQLKMPTGLSTEQRQAIIKRFGDSVETALRDTDVVFNKRQGEYDYIILLPNTSVEHASIVSRKMRDHFLGDESDRRSGLDLRVAVQALHEHDPNYIPPWKVKHGAR